MKKKTGLKRGITVIAAMLMISMLYVSCGSSTMNTTEAEVAYDSEGYIAEYSDEAKSTEVAVEEASIAESPQMEATGEAVTDTTTANVADNRKLITTVSLEVETEEYDVLIPTLEEKIAQAGGYIESRNDYNSGYYGNDGLRSSYMSIRIPSDQLDQFLKTVESQSNITYRNLYVQDVTLQYVDMESHKKMLLTEQDSLMKLLETAETVEDIITIESRLSEVRYQIESLESQLRTYDNLIEYSTVSINITEVERYTPAIEKGTWEKISTGFMENLYKVRDGLKDFSIGFVISLPIIFVWLFVIAIIAIIVRFGILSSRKKKQKKLKKAYDDYNNNLAMNHQMYQQMNPIANEVSKPGNQNTPNPANTTNVKSGDGKINQ